MQDGRASSETLLTSTIVEPPTSERSFAGSLDSFTGSDVPAMSLMKPQKEIASHPVPGFMLDEESGGEAAAATIDTNPAVPAIAGEPLLVCPWSASQRILHYCWQACQVSPAPNDCVTWEYCVH